MKICKNLVLVYFFFLVVNQSLAQGENVISLAGKWQVVLDSTQTTIPRNFGKSSLFINLPGTLDLAKIGTVVKTVPAINNDVMASLTRKHEYIGVAWYQRTINIPSTWTQKEKRLSIERVLWESTLFIDNQRIDSKNSLSGVHEFILPQNLTAGKHVITIAIDNRNKFPLLNVTSDKYPNVVNQDLAHAYTNHTQIKWNGMLGDISLRATEPNAPYHLQVYPDIYSNTIKASFGQKKPLLANIRVQLLNAKGETIASSLVKPVLKNDSTLNIEIPKPVAVANWSEFNPSLYSLVIKSGNHVLKTRFGFRTIETQNGNLSLNRQRIFLRGNLECIIFPLTGFPPTDKTAWVKLITQAKKYGLNHLRFHSWCPPKAAFDAADELGFYFQIELPHWSLKVGKDNLTTNFLRNEGKKILTDYGNHPSFLLMTLGNELEGDAGLLNTMVAELKSIDKRHLYSTTTFSFQRPLGTRPESQDDFFITQWTDKGWVRGQGIFNDKAPSFDTDYSAQSSHINVPIISHEIGQYSVYPDISEIAKYTGTLAPLNFIAVKNDLKAKGLLPQAKAFTHASGKLAALLYKEEIERALKTPEFDGFQLLQLQDYPGQGTALVGVLNVFWESKGFISASAFRQFNSELVPLLRFSKATYTSGDTLNATIEIANFYSPLKKQVVEWAITTESGTTLRQNSINSVNMVLGNNSNIGKIHFPINTQIAQKLTLNVRIRGTKYTNSWNIWVYPKSPRIESNQVIVTNSFEVASQALEKGAKVLLSPSPDSLKGIDGRFVPVFWSPVHFPNQPATMGLLMDNKHPALKSFPTDTHTDWQWWDLCLNSKSIIIDSMSVKPIVQVIDNFVTNHHLSTVFETKVGKGKLVFSSMDLFNNLNNRPVAAQLRHSLLEYMESAKFSPNSKISFEDLKIIKLEGPKKASNKSIYDN